MKKIIFPILALLLIAGSSCQEKIEIEKENEAIKRIAAVYHDLNPDDIDNILTEDFIGRHEKDRSTWNREKHRDYLTNGGFKEDSIFHQIAEDNWVATRFIRTMEYQGRIVKFEVMHFKRFQNGKIAEIWEYADTKQAEYEESETEELTSPK